MCRVDQDSRRMFRHVLFLICVLWGQAARAEVLVFAAASLKEPIDQLAADMDDVTVTYGGSGILARQISLGAPADVVLLANDEWMALLADGGHLQPSTVVDFASNRLVMVGDSGAHDLPLNSSAIEKALGGGRLAVGLTEAVPSGVYAKSALQSLGLWDGLESQLAEVDNVRAALALVVRGQAPLGIVFQTDVRISGAVRQVAVFPAQSHPKIRYQAALTANATSEAVNFLARLSGPEGQS